MKIEIRRVENTRLTACAPEGTAWHCTGDT
jgi:hypothetical protein